MSKSAETETIAVPCPSCRKVTPQTVAFLMFENDMPCPNPDCDATIDLSAGALAHHINERWEECQRADAEKDEDAD